MVTSDVLIIGGGLSGLCCALRLHKAGIGVQVLEASDAVGGRARTDHQDGFQLDRGFQVLLTAYPEARQVLDFDALDLRAFEPGALIRNGGKFHRLVDPWRRPRHAFSSALSPVASFADKLRIARLRRRVTRQTLESLSAAPETTTLAALQNQGFSERVIESFFRPFLGGVFLDRNLDTSSRMFEFVFRMFAQGDAVLPARGMGAMADQIATQLPAGTVRTQSRIDRIEGNSLWLENGEQLTGGQIVVACESTAAAKLLGHDPPQSDRGVTCVYFSAERPPIEEPILVLNGEGDGPINNLCVPTQVAPSYGPTGRSLISVTSLELPDSGDDLFEADMRAQLGDWFGTSVQEWRHLRTYRIPRALPSQVPPALSPIEKPVRDATGVLRCGDYLDTASIQGAMLAGRRAADAIGEPISA